MLQSHHAAVVIQAWLLMVFSRSFYDHYGQPDFTKVEALLGDQQDVSYLCPCNMSLYVHAATVID